LRSPAAGSRASLDPEVNSVTAYSESDGKSIRDAPIEAWWSAVLSDQPATPHPAHSGLRARLSHAKLLLSGVVTTECGRQEVLREAQSYCGETVEDIEDGIRIASGSDDEAGILSQTVFATFEDNAQAERAAEVLQHLSTVDTDTLVVLAGLDSPGVNSVPEAYRADVVKALAAGRGVLVATVDETTVLALREVLDQDTASLETVVTPPEVAMSGLDDGAGG
jgi:hypothetical protein